MMAGAETGLRLRARDADDLQVIAGVLQDAVVSSKEIAFLPDEHRFVAVFNRFRWEAAPHARPVADEPAKAQEDAPFNEASGEATYFERVNCGFCVDRVRSVRQRGVPRNGEGRFLELLTISAADDGIVLRFAGGAEVRLETRGILCHLEDLGEPWPTRWLPQHPDD